MSQATRWSLHRRFANLAALCRAHLPDQHEMQGFPFSKAVPSEIFESRYLKEQAPGEQPMEMISDRESK
jgi:hypothetical protein